MIKKLYECGCFNFQKFILDHTKSLALTSDEAIVLIKILEEFPQTKALSSEHIAQELALTKAKIDQALASLLERDFYEIYIHYDNGVGQEYITLDGFFTKVGFILKEQPKDLEDELSLVNQYLTKELNRILTSKELEIISSLILEDRYSLEDIERSCEALKEKGKIITIRALIQSLSVKEAEPVANTAPQVVQDFFKNIK